MSNHSFLGPFIGHTTKDSTKIWIHNPERETLWLSLAKKGTEEILRVQKFVFKEENLFSDCVELKNLEPETVYEYRIWQDERRTQSFDLQGLNAEDLFFKTLPNQKDKGENDRVDFLIMSCHDPDYAKSENEGYRVWSALPQILEENKGSDYCVRFALLGGDQVYADKWRTKIEKAGSPEEREKIYLEVYRHYWSNISYRKILCRLPSYLMWDDHEIMDGWGSSIEFFNKEKTDFNEKAKDLFSAADKAFAYMQAIRNPTDSLTVKNGVKSHDFCFTVGRCGFVMADLRSNRNLFADGKDGKKGVLWKPEQLDSIKEWVEGRVGSIDTLFFVTPVVMAHGDPVAEGLLMKAWNFFYKTPVINKYAKKFLKRIHLGDIRDDIRDSWEAEANAAETDNILNFLFSLQNEKNINTVVLSGDIHTAGYASIYSSSAQHESRSVIPHIVSSPVGSKPFPWILEAFYRSLSKIVKLGTQNKYTAQVSHHHSHRNVVVCSVRIRDNGRRQFLKVKFYLEDFPEPQIVIFDLIDSSHKENINWSPAGRG